MVTAKEIIGAVIEKSFRPPVGAPSKYWCYLMVDVPDAERITIRLHQSQIEQVAIGDTVRFMKPWRKNKRVRNIEILQKGHP